MTDGTPTDDTVESLPEEPRCYCPLGGVMALLSRKHAMEVVCIVGALGPVRYSEIETAFGGVSSSTLSTRLNELTEAELLSRERHGEIPPRVEYELTADGRELRERLVPLVRWVENRNGSLGLG